MTKLNKVHYTERRISNNLLKRNPTEKQAMSRRFIISIKNVRVGGHCKTSQECKSWRSL